MPLYVLTQIRSLRCNRGLRAIEVSIAIGWRVLNCNERLDHVQRNLVYTHLAKQPNSTGTPVRSRNAICGFPGMCANSLMGVLNTMPHSRRHSSLLVIFLLLKSALIATAQLTSTPPGSGSVSRMSTSEITAAPNQWTWMGGSILKGQLGSYGVLGTADPANIPRSRSGFSTWTDNNGDLWLFGGDSFNDLWKYSPSSNKWTWVSGSNPQSNSSPRGFYGTIGTPDPDNIPGGRSSALSWIDKTGNLWMFGGSGIDAMGGDSSASLNDLWKFTPATGLWTWISGSNIHDCSSGSCGVVGSYGTQGVPAPTNVPGGRYDGHAWIDSTGNLWLFGGIGLNDKPDPLFGAGWLSDVWMFNPSTNQWTWMSGSKTLDLFPVYGTKGVPATGNTPGIQQVASASWVDKNGHFWLFGGVSDELWEYFPETGQWEWVNGGKGNGPCNGCNYYAVYGTLGAPAPGNTPGGRDYPVAWTDQNGDFWIFGGQQSSPTALGFSNELWEYFPAINQWAWMGGINQIPVSPTNDGAQPGVFGSLGVPNLGNVPGGRYYAGGWTDGQGNLWLFGGEGPDATGAYGVLEDFWMYQPSSAPLPLCPAPALSSPAGTYGTIQTITFSDTANGTTFYYTTDGTAPTTNSKVFTSPITVSKNQTVAAIATASGCLPSDVSSASYTITSANNPAPVISSMPQAFANAPGGTITVLLNGSGFGVSSTAYWSSTALVTEALSATQLAITIPSTLDQNPGAFPITVQNPAPGGGTSNPFMFELDSEVGYWESPPVFSPSSSSIAAGSTATFPVTLPSVATNVSAACLNLPSGASCSYSASAKALTISTAGTTPAGTYQITAVFTETVPALGGAYIPFPFLFVPVLFSRRKKNLGVVLLGILLAMTMTTLVTGCGGGGGSSSTNPPPAQTHQVTSSGVVTLTIH